MQIPILAFIFQGIPEQIGITTLAFVLANVKLEWRKIVIIGFLLAIFVYLIRLLPISFGIHSILNIAVINVCIFRFTEASLNKAMFASVLGFLAIILYEALCLSILMPIFEITPEILFSNTGIRILITLPQVMLLYLTAFIVYKFKEKRGLYNGFDQYQS